MEEIVKGTLVKSKQGRDKGLIYAVKETDADFVYLVNGKERVYSNPKKKRIKHVQYINKKINITNCDDVSIKRKIKEALE